MAKIFIFCLEIVHILHIKISSISETGPISTFRELCHLTGDKPEVVMWSQCRSDVPEVTMSF